MNDNLNFIAQISPKIGFEISDSLQKKSLSVLKMKIRRSTEGQISKDYLKFKTILKTNQKWFFFYQTLGVKTVKNVQIDPQTTEIWTKMLNVWE